MALVAPLCSVGISLAYFDFPNAFGAAVLFTVNLVAIVLGAGVTFRMMGVTAKRAKQRHRRWVLRMYGSLAAVAILMFVPLERALEKNIEQGKPQPATYPLSKSVSEAVHDFVSGSNHIRLIAAGRPSSTYDPADVVLVIGSPIPVDLTYADELIEVVRREMGDDQLIVDVHCIEEQWRHAQRKSDR